MFSAEIFTLNKINHDVAEVIADENVFAYFVFSGDKSVTVKFPGGITHDSFPCHHCALGEVSRIWFLIRDAEMSSPTSTMIVIGNPKWKP